MCNLPALRFLAAILKFQRRLLVGALAVLVVPCATFAQPDTRAGAFQFSSSTYKLTEGDTDAIVKKPKPRRKTRSPV